MLCLTGIGPSRRHMFSVKVEPKIESENENELNSSIVI